MFEKGWDSDFPEPTTFVFWRFLKFTSETREVSLDSEVRNPSILD